MIPIRRTGARFTQVSRPWDYAANMAYNVRFDLDDLAQACRTRGLAVRHVERRDHVPELREQDCADFFLEREPHAATA